MGLAVLRRALPAILSAWLASGVSAAAPPAAPPAHREHCLDCHRPHPDAAGRCTACHRGNPATGRKALAHAGFLPAAYSGFDRPGNPATARGRELLARSGCRRCHVSDGEGTRLAADLDAAFEGRPGRLRDAILDPAIYMPDFRFDGEAVAALVNAIYANGKSRRPAGKGGREIPVKVHFAEAGKGAPEPPFARHCGGCHRALSGSGTGMGRGSIGPNLSALFTPFHPGRPVAAMRWTPGTLARWIANPRDFRPAALMPPLRVPDPELRGLADSLDAVPETIRR